MKLSALSSLALFAFFTNSTLAASFDCSKATTPSEHVICSDAILGRLDEQISLYYKALSSVSKGKEQLKQEQRAWLKQRNACVDAACTQASMQRRLNEILALSGKLSEPQSVDTSPQDVQRQYHGSETLISAPLEAISDQKIEEHISHQQEAAVELPNETQGTKSRDVAVTPSHQTRGAEPKSETKYLGLPYTEARALILADGWAPRKSVFDRELLRFLSSDISNLVDDFEQNGFTEFKDCPARKYCYFMFNNGADDLTVTVDTNSTSADSVKVIEANSYNRDLFRDVALKQVESYAKERKSTSPSLYPALDSSDCKNHNLATLPFLMMSNVSGSDSYKAYEFLIQQGKYSTQGYSVVDGACYQTIRVAGFYAGTQYDKVITGFLWAPMH